jgi:hypothetical protein
LSSCELSNIEGWQEKTALPMDVSCLRFFS